MLDPGDEDPFAIFLRPPKNESSAERVTRKAREAEVKKRSEEIDQEFAGERERLMNAERFQTRVALLGGPESGRSEMIKNLRMHHDRKKWNAELAKWRCVIQLKLIQSVIIILDALQAEGRDQWLNECPDAAPKEAIGPTAMNEPVVILPRPDIAPGPKSGIESDRQRVLLRLAPLRRVEQNLHKWLSASAEETAHPAGEKEWDREHEDALMMISMCREDIRAVWTNEKVQVSLREGKIHLEESAEFFLEEVDRVASRNYIPSDEDVARVRSRPVVQEYWINLQRRVDCPPNYNTGWCLYDISRPRRSRDVWIPYVEGLCAIMFFVDLSGFNSRLSDGSKVTQLEDSVILWRTICESPILQKAGLILFLTRGDLLKHKLESGIQVKDYVPSYGDRPNDVGAVVEYFKHHFKAIANRRATDKRSPLFVFTTSNVDVRTMETAIRAVEDVGHYQHLSRANLISATNKSTLSSRSTNSLGLSTTNYDQKEAPTV